MREGVLCWYPFEREASVLDLSNGALTELLERSCERVVRGDATNDADVANTTDSTADELFDYIVVIDPQDFSVDALKRYRTRLNPHGRLLLAYENPFALRYWSGKTSPVTDMPYSSLLGRDGRVSKAELQTRLKQAGFEGQKWYYPLSDHWFAREIYSESYLPNEFLNHRLIPYILCDENIQFDERFLYREVVRSGAFEFMCGAYLVEARANVNDEPCVVDYTAVTAYREPAKRFATIVRNDNTVHKIALHPDGCTSLQNMLHNHEQLARLGVSVISVRIEGNVLVMPRLELQTLWDYWAKKLSDGSFSFDEMVQHFDRIRDAIHKASADGDCYWELVPANCFYDADRDELIFFDQEYYWSNTPTDVAMTRALWALKYSPAFIDDPRTEDWLKNLVVRYGLGNKWEEVSLYIEKSTHDEVFGKGTAPLELTTDISVDIIRKYEALAFTQIPELKAERKAYYRRRERFKIAVDKLQNLGYIHPVIYGFGKRGMALKHEMMFAGVEIVAVIDQSRIDFPSIDYVLSNTNADVIIISVFDSAAIVHDLKSKTILPVITLEELLNDNLNLEINHETTRSN